MSKFNRPHPSHDLRGSDAGSFDEICTKCGRTDITAGGWGRLIEPCPAEPCKVSRRVDKLWFRVACVVLSVAVIFVVLGKVI